TRPARSFYRLPRPIAAVLERKHCAIQLKCEDGVCVPGSNVESGEYFVAGRRDWAVVCSMKKLISGLAFKKGDYANPSVVASGLPFETWIRPVSNQYTLDRARAAGGKLPPPLAHQCIEVNNDAKSSLIYCFDGQNWLVFQGKE